MPPYLLVNFGGPRNLDEIPSFLTALLCDRDVIRSRFPPFVHNWFFGRIARKRAVKVREDYIEIGDKSPIYFDTEALKEKLSHPLRAPVHTFHRYLIATHAETRAQLAKANEHIVLPLFPQFCYATTGSIARFFAPSQKLRWIKSYADHPAFIASYQRRIRDFLQEKQLDEKETLLLFSAHGVPKRFIEEGDPYEQECQASFRAVMSGFPKAKGRLCYQSKFGKGEWLRPYTNEACETLLQWNEGRTTVVFVPISFTSDHIETLFEIEKLYLPIVEKQGLKAYRCPALNLEPYWIDALAEIARSPTLWANDALVRK
ncbi:MAG: ferrochelatase [Verrucomicrobia bacterium]|nr:ferrochelatase [Verrucomicrobiota bacterium]MDE3047968.1 ferrochelatase [Verrucomicrobiota bacterium]